MATDDKEWLNREEAAAYLTKIGCPIAAGTLANLAKNNNEGNGPTFNKFRWNRVRYNRVDLAAWAKSEAKKVEYDEAR